MNPNRHHRFAPAGSRGRDHADGSREQPWLDNDNVPLSGAPDNVAALAVNSLMNSWPSSASNSTLLVVSNWL